MKRESPALERTSSSLYGMYGSRTMEKQTLESFQSTEGVAVRSRELASRD